MSAVEDVPSLVRSRDHRARQPAEPLSDLPLTRPVADRAAHLRGPDLLPRLLGEPGTRVLEVRDGQAQVVGEPPRLALRGPEPEDLRRLAVFLGEEAGQQYVGVLLEPGDELPELSDAHPHETDAAARWLGLRALATVLEPLHAGLLGQAVGVLNWHATHRHCPRCGAATEVTQAGCSRRCPQDGSDHWPRTDPAVIMAVVDADDRLLLGRHADWPPGRFSTLAGFVEPGESLETAVRREVAEEVGLRIGRVRYLGSQPWPFPASIMLGFTAEALEVDSRPDGQEIVEARWFTRVELATLVADGELLLSPGLSISRHLVEHWFGGPVSEPPVVGEPLG